VRVQWTPHLSIVHKRINLNRLDDARLPVCTSYSKSLDLTLSLIRRSFF
jgi:hypothetical protein